jgi:hypothetical protein
MNSIAIGNTIGTRNISHFPIGERNSTERERERDREREREREVVGG